MADDKLTELNAKEKDSKIAELSGITGTSTDEARTYLESTGWEVNQAAMSYYTHQEEEQLSNSNEPEEPYTGPRTLDGRPAPQAIPSVGSSAGPSRPHGGIATLGSIRGGNPDDSDETESDGEQPRDLFAGGEKSALAVQDPKRGDYNKKVLKDVLEQAKANASQPSETRADPGRSRFRGAGTTLGGDDVPSRTIPDPHAARPRQAEPLTRTLHMWSDGFSVDDGDLHRHDDPQHARDLEMIRAGRAPLHLMGAEPNQLVDINVIQHEEKYKKPKRAWKPFSGAGQRLGSPTPGDGSILAAPAPVSTQAAPANSAATEVNIDSSQPTISLRLQLLDGTRLATRFNTTNTVGDVYDFIDRASPESSSISWVLATTFPNKDHTDKSAILGEMSEFKKGGTAVQKRT